MNKLQLSNSQKIRWQFLAFTLEKISNSGELEGICKLSIWCSARARLMIETLSVSFACDVEHAHNHVNCTSFHVGLNYMINLICSRIYDAFDQNFMCFCSLFYCWFIFSFDRLFRFSCQTVLFYWFPCWILRQFDFSSNIG